MNQLKRKFYRKKNVFYLKNAKEPRFRMRATRRNLQKNLLEHQINESERNFSQKKYVYTLKKEKEPKISMGNYLFFLVSYKEFGNLENFTGNFLLKIYKIDQNFMVKD
jgi:hypothetical protein